MIDWYDPDNLNALIGFVTGCYLMLLASGVAVFLLLWLDARLKGRR